MQAIGGNDVRFWRVRSPGPPYGSHTLYDECNMKPLRLRSAGIALLTGLLTIVPQHINAQTPSPAPDGSHDFDFEIGTWRTTLRRLVSPLSGSSTWVRYEGTTVVRPLLDGRFNTAELRVAGTSGEIVGVALRLYDPAARQWSLNYATARGGTLTAPVFGGFRDGRGEFYGTDTMNGRLILVRFIISDITATSAHFEQAYSADGGRTWEVNWIADDTKVPDSSR